MWGSTGNEYGYVCSLWSKSSTGREIIWGNTEEGKKIPLDPIAPVYETLDRTVLMDKGQFVRRAVAYVSHFSTCSHANDFSSSRKRVEEKP